MGAISTNMEIHQSTASNLIKALVQKELITIKRSTKDRRSVELYMLPAGRKLLSKVAGPFEGVLPIALGNLNEQTLQQLNQGLGELITLLQADEAAEETPLAEIQ